MYSLMDWLDYETNDNLSTFCLLFVYFLSCFCLGFVLFLSKICHNKDKKIVICQDFPEKVLDLSDFCLEKFVQVLSLLFFKFFKTKIRQIQNFFRKILTNDNFFCLCCDKSWTKTRQNQDKNKTKSRQNVDKLSTNCRLSHSLAKP